MSIFVIGDLHLSFTVNKPMDVYGGEWINHEARVKEQWLQLVEPEDTVILPGDLSWGLKLSEAMEDLAWIDALPGQKVLFKGNHDLWWTGINKLNSLFDTLHFVQNTSYTADNITICGTRGWICPGDSEYTLHDEKIYRRELMRLRMSLEEGKKQQGAEILGVLHYPPTNDRLKGSGFTDLFEEYGVKTVVYGHLHGAAVYYNGLSGVRNRVEYILTSCDKLHCTPLQIR